MIGSVLRQMWTIYESRDVNNAFINTQKSVKRLKDSHQAVVHEFGMNYYGHITKHCIALRPNIGVITNIGTAHIGRFDGDINNLAKAKSELIQHMDGNGILLLNNDDENSKHLLTDSFTGTIIKVGVNQQVAYRGEEIEYTDGGMRFQVKLDGNMIPFFIPVFGVHNVYNTLFAIAIANLREDAQWITKAALEQGLSLKNVIHFEQKDDLFQALSHFPKGTLIW